MQRLTRMKRFSSRGQRLVTRPLNFKSLSDAMAFSISPLALQIPSGRITGIRVQDLAKLLWFNYIIPEGGKAEDGVWDKPPECTVGIDTLYIAFGVINDGEDGELILQMRGGTEVIAQKATNVLAGGEDGLETGTIPMPDSPYDIWIAVAP